jgi:hypothetical protein
LNKKVVDGLLDEITTVAMPIHNIWSESQYITTERLRHYRLRGSPQRDGTLKFSLNCEAHPFLTAWSSPHAAQVTIPFTKRTMDAGKWRSTNATDLASALGPRVSEEFASPAMCFTVSSRAPCSDYQPVWWSADRLVVSETGGTRPCTISIDVADLPGVSVEATEAGDRNAYSAPNPQAIRNLYDLTATTIATGFGYLADGAKVRHQLAASQLVGAASTVEQIETEIGGCLEPRPRVRAIEVTQAVQDWKNSVPLYAGKSAVVKVFLAGC